MRAIQVTELGGPEVLRLVPGRTVDVLAVRR
jgi:hypothetical protein